MKNRFVSDGGRRFMQGRKAMTAESIVAKYAKELANANPAQKLEIRERMARELIHRDRVMSHRPSPGTLW